MPISDGITCSGVITFHLPQRSTVPRMKYGMVPPGTKFPDILQDRRRPSQSSPRDSGARLTGLLVSIYRILLT